MAVPIYTAPAFTVYSDIHTAFCGTSTAACDTVLGTRSENKTSLKILPYTSVFLDNILNPDYFHFL